MRSIQSDEKEHVHHILSPWHTLLRHHITIPQSVAMIGHLE